jgi:hypothetical protein
VLDKIDTLTPIYYTYKFDSIKEDLIEDTTVKHGLLAQQVQSIYPELVKQDEMTGLLTLSLESLVPSLIQGVKELRNEINFLKAQNEYLLERIENLENQ